MNRNSQSRFAQVPNVDIKRSVFLRPFTHKTTGNVGNLIPFMVDEVLPGDTYSIDTAMVVRMTTPLKPVMDNAYIDTYYFFVPNRLLWEHWKSFCGQDDTDAWTDPVEYTIPQLNAPSGGWSKGTIADYMGIPTGVAGLSVNALPFRAYALIWNEWFRDQNLQNPVVVSLDDSANVGTNADSNTNPSYAELGGLPLKVSKFHDYFTSALPAPQKGEPVTLSVMQDVNVVPSDINIPNGILGYDSSQDSPFYTGVNISGSIGGTSGSTWSANSPITISNASFNSASLKNMYESNRFEFVAKTSQLASITVNELRLSVAIQRLLERDARGGTRYTEVLKAHFGVTSPDSRQQRPEYLGGKRVPINMNQVLQTSSSVENSPQGNTAAYSLTSDASSSFTYSSTEHGYILGLACVRTDHSYQQGLERMWSRQRRFDFYWPALANIGETAILNKEIFAQGNATDAEVFGYQEAWADYRYKPNRISGAFRSQYAQSLDIWHYGDDYESLPTLSSSWISEPVSNVDRTLAVPSSTEDQLLFDFAVRMKCARPMPVFSVPGLMDHN